MEPQKEKRKSNNVKKEPTLVSKLQEISALDTEISAKNKETSLMQSKQKDEQIVLDHISDVKQEFPCSDKNVVTESKEVAENPTYENCDDKVNLSGSTHDVKSKRCNACDATFDTNIALKNHLKNEHNRIISKPKVRRKKLDIDATFTCHVCRKSYTRKFDMEKHLKKMHPDANFISGGSRLRSEILERCRTESGENLFKCEFCAKVFNKSFNFLRHRNVHTNERKYFCEVCGGKFKSSGGLTRHRTETHEDLKPYTCQTCGFKFKNKHTLGEHMNIHTNARPFVCDQCGKAFKQRASLNVHKLFHTKAFRFTCNLCQKKFRRKHDLKVHSWLHTGERPYACLECGDAFRLLRNLQRHEKSHEKYFCDYCKSCFTQERYLKLHVKIHETNAVVSKAVP